MNTLIRWLRRLLELILGRPAAPARRQPTQNRPAPMTEFHPASNMPPSTDDITADDIAALPEHLAADEVAPPSAGKRPMADDADEVLAKMEEATVAMDADAGPVDEMPLPEEDAAADVAEPFDATDLASELTGLLEALLFVSESPASPAQFAQALERPEIEIRAGLADLAALYKMTGRGLRLQERNDRFSLVTAPQAATAIEAFLNLDLSSRLSGPALEALAIVAYRQPVTKSQIEAVRGVDCGGVLRTLLQRGLIEETGRLETAGRPILYGVTDTFMHHFGLENMQELPPLQLPDADALWAATELVEEG